MENLFDEIPLVKLLIAFAILFILIVTTFWLLRRVGSKRIGGASRGRQPRLAVIDAAAVDGRRRLVLIRRDNLEHLLMIGGPRDVVIEQNIVRAVPVAPARDAPSRSPGAPEPRAETPVAEPAARPPRPAVGDDGWSGQPPLRSHPESTSAGAAGPARPFRPAPPPEDARPLGTETRPPRLEPSLHAAPSSRSEIAAPSQPPVRSERREPTFRSPAPEVPSAAPVPSGDKSGEPTTVARTPPLTPDAKLADMAQRLEAALRRPIRPSGERTADASPKSAPPVEPSARPEPPSPAPAPPAAAGSENGAKGDKEERRPTTPPSEPATESKPVSPKPTGR
jgi:flagellar protein FliO/FliZ